MEHSKTLIIPGQAEQPTGISTHVPLQQVHRHRHTAYGRRLAQHRPQQRQKATQIGTHLAAVPQRASDAAEADAQQILRRLSGDFGANGVQQTSVQRVLEATEAVVVGRLLLLLLWTKRADVESGQIGSRDLRAQIEAVRCANFSAHFGQIVVTPRDAQIVGRVAVHTVATNRSTSDGSWRWCLTAGR